MLRPLLTLHFLFFVYAVATAQQNYSLSGKVEACYEAEYKGAVSNLVNLKLHSLETGKEYFTDADNAGIFSFRHLPAGSYQFKTAMLGFPDNDTIIIVDADKQDLTFCIDKAYRPATSDSIANYRNNALKDIEAGKIRIYEWTAWSVTKDPFKKLNPKVNRKYGFEYVMMGCVRQINRQEIEQVKLWESYNEVMYQHLTKVHGPEWRKTIKHERNKLRIN